MLGKIKAYAIGAALALALVAAWAASIFRKGAASTAFKTEREDRSNARSIEDVADLARRADGDPLDRLHKAGRLRDY